MSPLHRRYALETLIAAGILALLLMMAIPKFHSKTQPKTPLPPFPGNSLLDNMTTYPLGMTLDEFTELKRESIQYHDSLGDGKEFRETNVEGCFIDYHFLSDLSFEKMRAIYDHFQKKITAEELFRIKQKEEKMPVLFLSRIGAIGSGISPEKVCEYVKAIVERLENPHSLEFSRIASAESIGLNPIWKTEAWVMSVHLSASNELNDSIHIECMTPKFFALLKKGQQNSEKWGTSKPEIIEPTDTAKLKQIPDDLLQLLTPIPKKES